MASTAIDINYWRDTVKQRLPAGLRNVFEGGSKRDLIKHIGAIVLVLEDQVVNINSGEAIRLAPVEIHAADKLAAACRQLIEPGSNEESVLLLLPPGEFVATRVAMPGMARESLIAALQLQVDSLLPACREKLALVVNPVVGDSAQDNVALWVTESRLDTLFDAMHEEGLFLASVSPRNLALAAEGETIDLLDSTSETETLTTLANGAVTGWYHVRVSDFGDPDFAAQWQQLQAQVDSSTVVKVGATNAPEIYRQRARQKSLNRDYFLFPSRALRAKHRVEKGKRVKQVATALGIIALIASLPFLIQSVEMFRLRSALDAQQTLGQEARSDRTIVQSFEQEWGVINDFPIQNVPEALFALQQILSPEQLSAFDLSQGVISIEGESSEPQAILQRLEQDPMFTEVTFSRATSNNRYYIDLRLSTVNFEGYMVRHFPDE